MITLVVIIYYPDGVANFEAILRTIEMDSWRLRVDASDSPHYLTMPSHWCLLPCTNHQCEQSPSSPLSWLVVNFWRFA